MITLPNLLRCSKDGFIWYVQDQLQSQQELLNRQQQQIDELKKLVQG